MDAYAPNTAEHKGDSFGTLATYPLHAGDAGQPFVGSGLIQLG